MDYKKIYEYRFSSIGSEAREKVWHEISAFVYELMGRPEKVLDPAGGECEFIRSITAAKERWVVDRMLSTDEKSLEGIRFIQEDIFNVNLPPAYFGGIFVSNFLEHLDSHEKIFTLLVQLRESLKYNGIITIMGPNFKYSFKEYFDCADHKLALTHISIEELLYSAGYKIVQTFPRFLPYSFRGIFPHSKALTRIYLKCPCLWRAIGKQYLIFAKNDVS